MIEDCPETDIEFDALRLTIAHKLSRRVECFCSRATLDERPLPSYDAPLTWREVPRNSSSKLSASKSQALSLL
jgi:hypothetical protein